MSKLFIYFSETGSGDVVAEKMASLGYEIRKVTPRIKLPKSFFWRVFIGGFYAGIGIKDKLKDYDADVSAYDEIVVGSPIWNGGLSPAGKGILAKTKFEGKEVSFILYSGSGEGPKAVKQITKAFPEAKITFLKEPKKYPDELKKLDPVNE